MLYERLIQSVSLIIPEHRSWYIIYHCRGNCIRKILLTDFFATGAKQSQHYSKMHLHFNISFTSPREYRNICFHPAGFRVIPIPVQL